MIGQPHAGPEVSAVPARLAGSIILSTSDHGNMPRRRRTAIVLMIAGYIVAGGCSATPIPPTYTQDELRAICERERGWWHPDDLMGGYCEYRGGS
jgi:hypothetical protein